MHVELDNIAKVLQNEMSNLRRAFALTIADMNAANRALRAELTGANSRGASQLLFLQKTNSTEVGYKNASAAPDTGTEQLMVVTVSEDDGLVLVDKWLMDTPFDSQFIPAGMWVNNIYGFASAAAGNTLQLNFYKRNEAGVENLLHTVTNLTPITWTDKSRLIPGYTSDEGIFTVNPTDRLAVYLYASTDSQDPVTIRVSIAGKNRRSSVTVPIPQIELSAEQLALINTIGDRELSANKSTSMGDVNSGVKFPVWAAIKQWGLQTFLTSINDASSALLSDFPYNEKYISYFDGKWADSTPPTWDGNKYAGVTNNVTLNVSTNWANGIRPTAARIMLTITTLTPSVVDFYVTGVINDIPDLTVSTVGSGAGDEVLHTGTNIVTIPIDSDTDIVRIAIMVTPLSSGSLIYDITDIRLYTPKFTIPVLPTDSIGVAIQKLSNAISDLPTMLTFKTVNTQSISGSGNLYAPNYQELYFLTDEFAIDEASSAYFDDNLGCVLPAGVDSHFYITVIAPHYWDTTSQQVCVYWEHGTLSSAETNVMFNVQCHGIGIGGVSTPTFGNGDNIAGNGGIPDRRYSTGLSEGTTFSGTPVRDGTVVMRVNRLGSADMFTGDVYVKAIKVLFGLGDAV